ncbi:MAG: hypothetical protein WCA78_07920 [Rhizomicrobium sp.]
MELVAAGSGTLRTSRLTMHVKKVHHVTTISSVAEDFAVEEDWLAEVASEMDIEDGCIWVYGVGDDGVQAFTDDGMTTFAISSACAKMPRTGSSSQNSKPIYPRPTPDAYAK